MPSPSESRIEYFCTLFDAGFALQGVALYESLCRHAEPFELWVICMDGDVRRMLEQLAAPHLRLIDLEEIETPELRRVRPTRSRGEYCWTVTPFACQAVLDRVPEARRVTYVDADVYFFDDPRPLIEEMRDAGKQVLITEHAYAPEYDQSATSGRFCVQFMTFARADGAARVARWWQERCIEWCHARIEDGRFGDQKYLDAWPSLFGEIVHVSTFLDRTLAPWNIRGAAARHPLRPTFFHFHGLRRAGPAHLQLYWGYRVGRAARPIYRAYVGALRRAAAGFRAAGVALPDVPRLTFRERMTIARPRVRARFVRF